jgi:hypothetical protein
MEMISELRKQKEQVLISEIDAISNELRLLDPKSEQFTLLLVLMKRKINLMSDS